MREQKLYISAGRESQAEEQRRSCRLLVPAFRCVAEVVFSWLHYVAKSSKQFPSKAWLIPYTSRRWYIRAAVLWNRSACSVGEKSRASRLKAFQLTVYEQDCLSTGTMPSCTTLTLALNTPEMHIPPWLWFSKYHHNCRHPWNLFPDPRSADYRGA